jgi:hypothetical protein
MLCCAVNLIIVIFIFFKKKITVGAVLDWTDLTNADNRGGWDPSRPYSGH